MANPDPPSKSESSRSTDDHPSINAVGESFQEPATTSTSKLVQQDPGSKATPEVQAKAQSDTKAGSGPYDHSLSRHHRSINLGHLGARLTTKILEAPADIVDSTPSAVRTLLSPIRVRSLSRRRPSNLESPVSPVSPVFPKTSPPAAVAMSASPGDQLSTAVIEDSDSNDDGGDGDGDDDEHTFGSLATLSPRRGRQMASTSDPNRSSSVDVAKVAGLAASFISVITAASKVRFNRMGVNAEDDEREVYSQAIDDLDEDDDNNPDLQPEASSSSSSSNSDLAASITSKPPLLKRPSLPTASSFLLQQDSQTAGSPLALHPSGTLSAPSLTRSDTADPEDAPLLAPLSNSTDSSARSVDLSEKLMDIFNFPHKEAVQHEFPCYLWKNVMLEGHLFITSHHISFFAYIPRLTNATIRAGTLSRRVVGPRRHARYWCTLKDNVMSYYNSASDLYFPVGSIDLRYASSAGLVHPEVATAEDKQEPVSFRVVTQTKKYIFRADTLVSAQEWVHDIQRSIFRAHNDGDSVKIVIPTVNVLDIDESSLMQCATTVKINVVDVDTNKMEDPIYEVQEFFFTFFIDGSEAHKALYETLARNQQQNSAAAASTAGPAKPGDSAIRKSKSEGMPATMNVQESIMDTTITHHHTTSPSQTGRGRPSGGYLSVLENARRTASRLRSRSGARSRSRPQSPTPSNSSSRSPNHVDSARSMSPRASFKKSGLESEYMHEKSDLGLNSVLSNASDEMDGSVLSTSSLTKIDPEVDSLEDSRENEQYHTHDHDGWSDWMRRGGRKFQNMLPNMPKPPTGYVDKVAEMWIGDSKHFEGAGSSNNSNSIAGPGGEIEDNEDHTLQESERESSERFRAHFALSDDEKLVASFYGYLHRAIPLYGKIYLGKSHVCFRSLLPGTKTTMILPHDDIENVEKKQGFRFGYAGMVVVIHGHEELFFEFRSADHRDDCVVTLLRQLDELHHRDKLTMKSEAAEDGEIFESLESAEDTKLQKTHEYLSKRDMTRRSKVKSPNMRVNDILSVGPIIFENSGEDQKGVVIKPAKSLRFTCLTIGSRGDVQPYIALAKGLIAEGHQVRIATHAEFKPWIEKYGIEFREIAGDPAQLMRLSVEHGMFTYSFLKEAAGSFRGWIHDLLETSWVACKDDTDVLIESPSAMAGFHIAEKLRIPYFRAFTMPWTRTRAYPHAFIVPDQKMGGGYNYMTYVMFDNVFWKGISGQVNKFRTQTLGLSRTSLEKMQPQRVPFLYNFSPTVVPPPLDFADWIKVTGYWFLDEGGSNFEPDPALVAFIAKARKDGKKLVYIGFGSIVVAQPAELTKAVIESVLSADVRCVLSKGWSDRLNSEDAHKMEIELPAEVFQIKSAPHDWLFPQMDAAVHHGGSGSTGASLRMGVPTVIKPFFGDQFFYANRVEDLGAGLYLRKLTARHLSKALWEATHNERIIAKARAIGTQIRKENGVKVAIETMYRDMDYARSVILPRGGPQDDKPVDDTWYVVERPSC
ncbi:UDP-Glycosyltransferase/glycogen phosphorylase [Lipomyces oligophaga]|uniref:UDP-Glycosyltransferase/glycogen phosphorylase n=1 Tax=Lipomyces oligophaga TaxID=45792 RepID=UPI0034CD54CA